MLNLSSLFHSDVEKPTLLDNITLSDEICKFILEAKEDIRAQLRTKLPAVLKELGYPGAAVQPRFLRKDHGYTRRSTHLRTPNSKRTSMMASTCL